ncbi:MAG: bifunctional glutamate N-acetyltransferase/amino-acid acetyltransferase ArgJ [Desulfosalsimonadaceae bacterium]
MVKGFKAAAVASGLKKTGDPDLGIIYSVVPAAAAGVFTTNRVQAAPVVLSRERIRSGLCQSIIVNSGNANCCTGEKGMADAAATARAAARSLGISEDSVLVASTGVIGAPLAVERIEAAVPLLADSLSGQGWPGFARSIMTTDTVPKTASRSVLIGGKPCTIMAVAKGAGMIRPDMATMLCFVCTDAAAEQRLLSRMLQNACEGSFNRITIDGDTSTNDTVLLLANGRSGSCIEGRSEEARFQEALNELLGEMARMIVKDGEGATKLVEVAVTGAKTRVDAGKVADAVANSSLVKTALFGEDANWGRIMAAAGRSGADLVPGSVSIWFDSVQIAANGQAVSPDAEERATEIIRRQEFTITIDLQSGDAAASVLTCDFSIEYVKINADYRS